jgi:hypothetical protein
MAKFPWLTTIICFPITAEDGILREYRHFLYVIAFQM